MPLRKFTPPQHPFGLSAYAPTFNVFKPFREIFLPLNEKFMDKLKKVYHRLLGEGFLEDIVQFDNPSKRIPSPDYAIVYFAKKIPLEQLFASQEYAIKDWKLDVDSFVSSIKPSK